jgi:hypothetical protein
MRLPKSTAGDATTISLLEFFDLDQGFYCAASIDWFTLLNDDKEEVK